MRRWFASSLVTFLAACATPAPPVPSIEIATPPATQSGAPPAEAAPAKPAAKPTAKPAAAPRVARSACMFCRHDMRVPCSRPEVTEAEMVNMPCDVLRLGALWARPRLACDPSCCLPAGPTGPDSDGDGIPDALDKCPTIPEDNDGYEDIDGCPDPDNDGDGLEDSKDRCCWVAGIDARGKATLDGCPH